MIALLIQIIAGAAGGNFAGSMMKENSLGTLGNSIAGIVGGAAGGQLLSLLVPALGAVATGGASWDLGSIIGQVAGGGVGGGLLMAIIGLARQSMATRA